MKEVRAYVCDSNLAFIMCMAWELLSVQEKGAVMDHNGSNKEGGERVKKNEVDGAAASISAISILTSGYFIHIRNNNEPRESHPPSNNPTWQSF